MAAVRPVRASPPPLPRTDLPPRPDRTVPKTTTSDAAVSRIQLGLRSRPQTEAQHQKAVLMAGGLSAEAADRIIEQGLTRDTATDLLTVDLLHPTPDRYGPATVTLSVLAEARAEGALSARQVKARLRALRKAAVLRPDGYLVPALGGRPIEKRADLALGQVYFVSQGILRERNGTPIGELGLKKTAPGALLDGVESAVMTGVIGLAHQVDLLIHRPDKLLEESVHSFGRIPETVARFIRTSPELLAAYEAASPDDQLRFLSEALTHTALLATALLLTPAKGGAPGPSAGLGTLQLQGAELALSAARLEATASAVALAQLGVRVTVFTTGAVLLAESLDLHPSSDPRIGPTTEPDPKTRHRVRDRIKRTLGDPQDPNVPLEELEDHVELAEHLGDDAVKELKAMILVRLKREVESIDSLPPELQAVKVEQLRRFAEETGILIRDALRAQTERPPLSSLSMEAQRAVKAIRRGATEVRVTSRQVAEEILTQFGDYVDTGGWPTSRPRKLLESKEGTYHWDEVFGPDGRLQGHAPDNPHANTPHLQLHHGDREVTRILFPRRRSQP